MLTTLACAFLSLASAPAVDVDLLDLIEQRRRDGVVDEATSHALKVQAVRAPQGLPDDLRAHWRAQKTAGTLRPAMATRALVEAFQWTRNKGAEAEPVRRLLLPPDDLPNVLESSTHPIRVSYPADGSASQAQQVLAAADRSWDVEVGQYGFTAPIIETGAERYRIQVDDTGMGGGGYTAPYDWASTGRYSTCHTYIVIDRENPSDYIDSTVAHELNHAMQGSMDCAEISTFWENTATYIMSAVYPSAWFETLQFVPYFQNVPWRALDYMDERGSDGYEYGGTLLPIWLVDVYGQSDGPIMLRQIWEATRQSITSEVNVPNYYDAIAEVIGGRGGSDSMGALTVDFSEARYFVGQNDDRRHMSVGQDLYYNELTVAASHGLADLPVVNDAPPTGMRPAPFGSSHIELEVSGERPVVVEFTGGDSTRWAVRAVAYQKNQDPIRADMEFDPGTWEGGLTIDPAGRSHVLLVVVNLGSPSYDPNARRWPVADYTYSVREVPPTPVLTRLDPAEVTQGDEGVAMHLSGSNFVAGEGFRLQFDDEGLTVVAIDQVTADGVDFTLNVATGAGAGEHTLTVFNDVTVQAAAPLLTVVKKPLVSGLGFLGCTATASSGAGLGVWLMLAGLLLRRRQVANRR